MDGHFNLLSREDICDDSMTFFCSHCFAFACQVICENTRGRRNKQASG